MLFGKGLTFATAILFVCFSLLIALLVGHLSDPHRRQSVVKRRIEQGFTTKLVTARAAWLFNMLGL